MKNVKKLLSFAVVFMVVMVAFCSMSFAADSQYTENLIPKMTSDTAPSGIASASNTYDVGNNPAWKAFDKKFIPFDTEGCHIWATRKTSAWLAYEFNSPTVITKYTIQNSTHTAVAPEVTSFPSSWNFEAWDDSDSKWIILDSRTAITWIDGEKKEFTFDNSFSYKKYRLNILSNGGTTSATYVLLVGELEMMGPATHTVQSPTNLITSSGNSEVNLSWDTVDGATSYNIKRATTAGGPYTTITTTSAITYTDTTVTNGTTYYYVVTAIVNGVESEPSNEASATPTAPVVIGNPGILEITMTNGQIKEYDMTGTELQDFLAWYDNRSNGTGKSYYIITKKSAIKPFLSRKEYISFDKISSFEVKEYAE